MASEARIFTISPDTTKQLEKFRLSTSRASKPQARIYAIDKKTYEIKQDDDETYTSLNEIAEELPPNTPRYVLLSYPVTLKSGRLSTPYVLLYYLPANANHEFRMMYAGAKELFRNASGVGKILDCEDTDEVLKVGDQLAGEE